MGAEAIGYRRGIVSEASEARMRSSIFLGVCSAVCLSGISSVAAADGASCIEVERYITGALQNIRFNNSCSVNVTVTYDQIEKSGLTTRRQMLTKCHGSSIDQYFIGTRFEVVGYKVEDRQCIVHATPKEGDNSSPSKTARTPPAPGSKTDEIPLSTSLETMKSRLEAGVCKIGWPEVALATRESEFCPSSEEQPVEATLCGKRVKTKNDLATQYNELVRTCNQ
jgi:hypothetical protein